MAEEATTPDNTEAVGSDNVATEPVLDQAAPESAPKEAPTEEQPKEEAPKEEPKADDGLLSDEPQTETKQPEEEAKKEDAKTEGYQDFTVPEELNVDSGLLKDFSEIAQEDGLSQEQAQRYVDLISRMEQQKLERAEEFNNKQRDEWRAEFKSKAGWEQDVLLAKKALNLMSDDFAAEVKAAPMSDYPPFVNFLAKVGSLISEAPHVEDNYEPAPVSMHKQMFKGDRIVHNDI